MAHRSFLFAAWEVDVTVNVTTRVQPAGNIAKIIRPMVDHNVAPKVHRAAGRAKQLAPVGTGTPRPGRLRDSIFVRQRDAGGRFASKTGVGVCSYEIVVGVPYGRFPILGTAPHIIKARGPWSLYNYQTRQAFGPIVRHPGQRPNDFLGRAVSEVF